MAIRRLVIPPDTVVPTTPITHCLCCRAGQCEVCEQEQSPFCACRRAGHAAPALYPGLPADFQVPGAEYVQLVVGTDHTAPREPGAGVETYRTADAGVADGAGAIARRKAEFIRQLKLL